MGDNVVVHTGLGIEIGEVVGLPEIDESKFQGKNIKKILRKANAIDLDKKSKRDVQKKEVIQITREYIQKYKLEMKVVDIYFSLPLCSNHPKTSLAWPDMACAARTNTRATYSGKINNTTKHPAIEEKQTKGIVHVGKKWQYWRTVRRAFASTVYVHNA